MERIHMSESSDDLRLLEECINGGKEAWDTFVKRYSKLIFYSINKTLKLHNCNLPQDDVDDLFNGVFVSLLDKNYKKLRQYEGRQGCTLTSWIRLITVRHTIDFLRSQKQHVSLNDDRDRSQPLIDTVADDSESFGDRLESSQAARALKDAIDELPASDRLFMELFYEKELPPEEIAVIMNVSINTIYSKKNRVRDKLKKILIERGAIARNPD
jgi:RNA polymerase sigma-70 factor (ECF subfamily)